MMKRVIIQVLMGISLVFAARASTLINSTNHFAYASNLGWVDWRGDALNGAVVGDHICSGYVYAANVGWINLGKGTPTNGIRYSNLTAADFGVNQDGFGNLQGYGWGANVGWLLFTNRNSAGSAYDGPRVNLLTGQMSGYIWGANVGWISLTNSRAFVQLDRLQPEADTDHDGIPDAWELEHFGNLTKASATSDQDGDGQTDLQEYLAGTDPLKSTSQLVSTATTTPGNSTITLAWPSQLGYQYRILRTDQLGSIDSWTDVGLGWINPDPGGITSRPVRASGSSSGFYLIEAFRPLGP
jgi:hypothetical protein